ncbi:hypothetical protein J2W42_002234 [Rhizobium tibeticum]|uniref:hypothetical protein n=1 Tax=Rhizobium tibeticum TaxID=501024 RepID=UPI002788137B|nr:hypothetical protein [Rhizobium tibeticum]MDP9809386.1 hypothetical protein [Rhizobium tibeticum]
MTAAGHNTALNDEEKQALWGHHVRRRLALKHKRDDLAEEEKTAKKDAKNDGFAEAEIKDFIDCMTTDDPQKKVDNFNMLRRNRIRLGLIQDDRKQDLLGDRVTNEQMIYAAGVEAGLAALDRVSKKYQGGSSEDRAWLDGYDEGQRIARENLQSAMEKRNAAKAATTNEEPPAGGDDPFTE